MKIFEINPDEVPVLGNLQQSDVKIDASFLDDELRPYTEWERQVTNLVVEVLDKAAQQRVHLTALRRGLALSIFINVALLAVVAFTIGGR